LTTAITYALKEKPFQLIITTCCVALIAFIASLFVQNNINTSARPLLNDMRSYNAEEIKAMLCREKHETLSDVSSQYQIDIMSLTFHPDGTFKYQSGGRDNGDYFVDSEKSGTGTYTLEGPFTMMAGPGYQFDTYNYVRIEGQTADGTLIPMQLKQVVGNKNPNADWVLCNGDNLDQHEKYFPSFAMPMSWKK